MSPSVAEDNDVQAPWITREFLQNLLRGEDDTSGVTVADKHVELAVAKGDNYLSILYRVHVGFEPADRDGILTRHLIIKVLPAGEFMQNIVHEIGFFKRELQVYNVALPALYRLQKTPAPLSPRIFFTSRPDTLVLEDLRPQGFVMSDRRNRLDLPHCRLVVRSLARLHGLSAVLIHREPNLLADFVDTMYTDGNKENLKKFLEPQIKTLADVVETWPGHERFGPLIRDLAPVATDRLIETTKPIEGGFEVLNHGDCWINNVLFLYSSSGEVENLKFVDFQLSRVSSPAIDLQYFLYTSPQDEVREQFWDCLLEEYHEALCSTVRELDSDVYVLSLQELLDEIRRMAFFGFMSALTTLAAVVGDPTDSPDMANFKDEPEPVNIFEKIQNSPRFRKHFQRLLIIFEKVGIFR